jgi:hypothetical protein
MHALARTLWVKLLLPIPPKLAILAFTFCQPLALTRIIAFLENSEDISIGYGLVGAYALVYVGLAVRPLKCELYARGCKLMWHTGF